MFKGLPGWFYNSVLMKTQMWKAFTSMPTAFLNKALISSLFTSPKISLSLPVLQLFCQLPWVTLPTPTPHPQNHSLGKPQASFEVQLFPPRQLDHRLTEAPLSLLLVGHSPELCFGDLRANLSRVSSSEHPLPRQDAWLCLVSALPPSLCQFQSMTVPFFNEVKCWDKWP